MKINFGRSLYCGDKSTVGKISLILAPILLLIMVLAIKQQSILRFSHEPGFYNEEIYLEILGDENYSIYYTTDSSEPTQDSILYTGPIYLQDATQNPNNYSNLDTLSTGFYKDMVEEYSTAAPGYVVPSFNVDKCNVIRAAMYDNSGKKISEITGSFFIGFQNKPVYQDTAVVSIISDPEHLFDYESGIYVTGKTFDEYKEIFTSPLEEGNTWPNWWHWEANYHLNGQERVSHIEIYGDAKDSLLSEKCGIRIHGGVSGAYLPKGLGVYARSEYSGSEEFRGVLFESEREVHKFVVFGGGNDCIFKVKDYLVHTLTQNLNFSTMDMIPCMTFMNGEFWGACYLTENYNSDYINDYYQVPENEVVMVKTGTLHEGEEDDLVLYQQMYGFIAGNDMSQEENYRTATELIDIDSFLDYYTTEIYLANLDWPQNNTAAWRSRTVHPANSYMDGKWRWMLFDLNGSGMTQAQVDMDTLGRAIEMDAMLSSLLRNEEFKQMFVERLLHIGTDVFAPEKCSSVLDEYLNLMLEAVCANNMRFYGSERRNEVFDRVEFVQSFFDNRSEYMRQFISLHLGVEYLD